VQARSAIETTRPFAGAFVVVAAVVLSWPVTARAESAPGADESFRQGVRAMRAGQYDQAIAYFNISYQLQPRASTMCNLAQAYENTSQYRQAGEAYRRCAADDTEGRFRDHALDRARAMEEADRRASAPPRVVTPQPRPQVYSPQPQPAVQPQPVVQPQPRRSRSLLWLGVGTTVLGLGALGAGVGLNVWVNGIYDDLAAEYGNDEHGWQVPAGSSDADLVEQGRTGTNASIGLYVAGGVLTAAGVALIIVDLALEYQSSRTPRVAVVPSRDGVTLALSLSFPGL
jgi:hypothetical protein